MNTPTFSKHAELQLESGAKQPELVIQNRNHTVYHVVAAAVARWGIEDVQEVLAEYAGSDLLKEIEAAE